MAEQGELTKRWREWREGDYVVTTDPARYDVEVVTDWLAGHSYWAQGRTREVTERAAANSRCYSILHGDVQVGGARAVTDYTTFAWIADVFVVPEEQGHGLGKFLMRCITDDLADVLRLFLGTRDAHGLYSQFGFVAGVRLERWMERVLVTPDQ